MAPSAPSFQFIHQDHPADGGYHESRKQARSHAARIGHVRSRQARNHQYQAQKEEPANANGLTCEAPNSFATSTSSSRPDLCTAVVPGPSSAAIAPSSRRDPFISDSYAFKPLENFLFHHYISNVIPYINSFCGALKIFNRDLVCVTADWVKLALIDATLRDAIYLAACRHLWKTSSQESYFYELSVRYKITCMRALDCDISHAAPINSSMIAKVAMLAWDEVALGDMITAGHHMKGALKMLEITPESPTDTRHLKNFLQEALHSFDVEPHTSQPIKGA